MVFVQQNLNLWVDEKGREREAVHIYNFTIVASCRTGAERLYFRQERAEGVFVNEILTHRATIKTMPLVYGAIIPKTATNLYPV